MNYRGGTGVVLAMLLATTACHKQATGQSVAVVNDQEISQGELNDELTAANVPESADKKQVMPQLLQRVLDRKLVAQKASQEGIDKSPEYLSRQRRLNENLLIGMYTQKLSETIKPATQGEIDAFIAQHPNMFAQRQILSLDQLAFDRPSDMTLLNQLKDAHSLDAVAASLGKLGVPFKKGAGQLDLGTIPATVAQQILNLPAGEPFVAPSGGKIVVSVVTGRQPAPVDADQARRIATEGLRRQKLAELLEKQVKDLRASAKIQYQPGYEPKTNPGNSAAPAAPAKAGG